MYFKAALSLCHKTIPTLIKHPLCAKSICTSHNTYHAMYHSKILSNKPIYIPKYIVNV